MIDATIVGGGPTGLVTALYLRRAGLEPIVLEPRRAPIDKACGEGIMPTGLAALAGLNVRPDGFPLRGVTYHDRDRVATADFRGWAGLGVRRTELHSRLHDAVAEAGIEVLPLRATAVHDRGDHVEVAGLRSRYVVGADGLHSTVRADAGLTGKPVPARRRRWGLRAHFEQEPWSEHVEVYWSPVGEAYLTPVASDLVGVAILGGRGDDFVDRLAHFPMLARRLPDTPAAQPLGCGPLRQRVRRVTTGRVLLVGDAAGYVDALTGEGLSTAFACAHALAACLREDRPDRYLAEHRRLTRRSRLVTLGLLTAAQQPRLRRHIVPLAARFPALFEGLTAQLVESPPAFALV